MISLTKFYAQKSNIYRILPMIQGKSAISLRLIDWFVTNYSKKHSTIITHAKQNNIVHFNVYLSYRSQLKAYSKHLFDPFRRRNRITFFYEKDKSVETTIAQLNVFRWLLTNHILEYIEEHKKEIEEDMLLTQKDSGAPPQAAAATAAAATATKAEARKKRVELSKSFIKNMNTYEGAHHLRFD